MADVVLKDKIGNPVTYVGVTAVQLQTPDGGMQLFSEGGGSSGGKRGIEVLVECKKLNEVVSHGFTLKTIVTEG